jgi:hypothetical protein
VSTTLRPQSHTRSSSPTRRQSKRHRRVHGLQPLDNTSDRASPTGPALHQDNGSKHRSAKSRKAREMFSSTMLAIFDSRPPSSRKEGRHQGQVHWLVCTQSPGLAHPSASHLRYQLTEIPDPIGDYCLHTRQTVQALSCVGKVPLGAKRKGGICSSGKTLPARKVQGSGVRCQVVVSAEENHSCPVYWAAPGGPGSRAKARDCFCLPCFMCLWRQATDSIRLQDGPCLVAISYSPLPPPSPMSSSPPRRPLWSYTGTPQLPIGESGSVRSETPDQKREA